jgi:hypothetical protein
MPVLKTQINFRACNNPVQARIILAIIEQLLSSFPALAGKKVGITYSANSDQTEEIRFTYQENGWQTRTNGANQAAVMHQVEQYLESEDYKCFRTIFRIMPITTINRDRNRDLRGLVQEDLACIEEFVREGNMLLIWCNQDTGWKPAIGGGISANFPHYDEVRDKLEALFSTYPLQGASYCAVNSPDSPLTFFDREEPAKTTAPARSAGFYVEPKESTPLLEQSEKDEENTPSGCCSCFGFNRKV